MAKNEQMYQRLASLFLTVEYKRFIEFSNTHENSIKWSKGVISPFSILPFEFELNGFKRGKYLKAEPKNKKNCYLFQLAHNDLILSDKRFCDYYDNKELWLVEPHFFQYNPNEKLSYSFESCLSDSTGADILSISLVQLSEKLPRHGYIYTMDYYHEFSYFYEKNRIKRISLDMWLKEWEGRIEPHTQEYHFEYDNNNVCITLVFQDIRDIVYNDVLPESPF